VAGANQPFGDARPAMRWRIIGLRERSDIYRQGLVIETTQLKCSGHRFGARLAANQDPCNQKDVTTDVQHMLRLIK
jgi:hypothetical protein